MRLSVQLLALVFFVSFFALIAGCSQSSSEDRCFDRLWRVTHGIQMYADDNDDTFPTSTDWMDRTAKFDPSLESMFHDPELPNKDEYGYAYRDKASGIHSKTVDKPDAFELVFDSTLPGRNAHGDVNTLPSPGRHNGGNNIGFLDGHVKHIDKD